MNVSDLRTYAAQFANTFKEWHYLTGGFCIGFLAGVEYYRRYIAGSRGDA